jgi:hypothetical protein
MGRIFVMLNQKYSGAFRARRWFMSTLIFVATASIASAQQASPVLNKPYRCTSGLSYMILECKPYGNNQMCTYREDDKNGNPVTTMNSLWTQMTGRLAGCTVADSTPPAAIKPSTPSAASAPTRSGALNPAYLNQFPSVDQVISQLKGTDAKDTTNLQLGTLRQLPQFIEDLAGQRWIHNQMTPDESRLIGAYTLAYNNLAKPLNFPFDNYFNQSALLTKLASTFSMSQVISQWEGGNQKAVAASAANLPPAPKPASTSKTGASGSLPGTAGVRRCAELGGDVAACEMGDGILGILSSTWMAPTPGLRLTGSFKSSSGLTLDFNDDAVVISGCSQMVSANHSYTIQPQGNQFAVSINNQPQSFLVALGADGKLVGPAAVTIAGQVITGYNDGVAGMKNTATNTPVPGTVRVVHDPIYAAKTATCAAGTMAPGQIDAASGDAYNDVAMMFPGAQTVQNGEVPGARLVGKFAGAGGLKIEFQSTGAVIDCAQAHVVTLYQVASTPSGVTITLKNGSSPFSLTLQSNGTLSGTGSAKVDGRLVSGQTAAGFTFTSVSASCAIGTLTVTK